MGALPIEAEELWIWVQSADHSSMPKLSRSGYEELVHYYLGVVDAIEGSKREVDTKFDSLLPKRPGPSSLAK